jgi:hypothetical protein
VNQIFFYLTQEWFLLQDIKGSFYFRNGVFNNEEYSAVACLAEFRQKFTTLNCNRYMQPEILPSQSTYGHNVKVFFDLKTIMSIIIVTFLNN